MTNQQKFYSLIWYHNLQTYTRNEKFPYERPYRIFLFYMIVLKLFLYCDFYGSYSKECSHMGTRSYMTPHLGTSYRNYLLKLYVFPYEGDISLFLYEHQKLPKGHSYYLNYVPFSFLQKPKCHSYYLNYVLVFVSSES